MAGEAGKAMSVGRVLEPIGLDLHELHHSKGAAKRDKRDSDAKKLPAKDEISRELLAASWDFRSLTGGEPSLSFVLRRIT